MTPEERARKFVQIDPEDGQGRTFVVIKDAAGEVVMIDDDSDGPAMVEYGQSLRRAIAEIIHAAVAEEREACARLADNVVDPAVLAWRANPAGRSEPCTLLSSNAAEFIAQLIRRQEQP